MHVLTAFRDCQGARISASAAGAQALSETLGVPVSVQGFQQVKKVENRRGQPQEPGKGEAEERAKDVVAC